MRTHHSMSAVSRGPDPATIAHERERLAIENPISFHELIQSQRLARICKRALGAGILLLLGFGSIAMIVNQLRTHQPGGAVVIGIVTLLLFFGASRVVKSILELCTDAVEEIAVCPGGLRWTRGKKLGMAVWSEITQVHLKELAVTGRGGLQSWSASMQLTLRSGETMILESNMLTNFVALANTVNSNHVQTVQKAQTGNLSDAIRGALPARLARERSMLGQQDG
jgi:hypothetical protein